MLKNCTPANQLPHLAPEVYFKDRVTDFLKQADVIRYEDDLKGVVGNWMKDANADDPESPYQQLLVQLRKHSDQAAWKANSKARERDAQRASRQKKDDTREGEPVNWQSLFDPDEPTPEFSFANTKCGYSKEELRKDIRTLRWQNTPQYLISALERGIAVHHAGMPKGYRSLAERLGYCRVVISTGTLALGINAPAKTVIFLDDSPYLTALMFRQCAGRAGRRGFDLLGKVVFYNFPLDRIHRLMLSRIPPLTGNWPLTTTLCLRLFNLLTGSGQAPAAVSAIDSFMRLPRLSVSSDQSREEVLHHMRFSIDFLQRSRLLSSTGQTTALFGIVGHSYYEEPGNLAFAALIRAGVLHQMCSTFKTHQIDTEKNIICLVATLLARRPLPYFASYKEVLEERRKKFPSIIKLPTLPNYVLKVLEDHNRETLRVFTAYATTFATQHLQERPDNILPLSRQEVGASAKDVDGGLGEILRRSRIKGRVACSSFVSNSGHNDALHSVADLCRSARSGLHLNGHSIPYFDYTLPVNAYAYDFWQHESVRPLSEANGIRRGDVWFALQSFFLALTTLTASLRALLVDRAATEEVSESDELGDEQDLDLNAEKYDIEEDELLGETVLKDRPRGIPEEDWLVYEAFQSVTSTFYQKWKKTWA
ncbi:hypothetical protein FRC07_002452 [Ceratobasidium sp. 392]|nr:hypothetical protein FRC07_002452 [Ceratobasidium sp. 392]